MSKRLLSGHEFEEVKEEEAKNIGMDIFNHGSVRILPEGWLYPAIATTFLDKLHTMKVLIHSSFLFTVHSIEAPFTPFTVVALPV